MFYVAPDGKILDDGQGDNHAPYAIDGSGRRVALPQKIAALLASRYAESAKRVAAAPQPPPPGAPMPFAPQDIEQMRSMFPIGDIIAKLTSSVGIQPCEPCKRRQDMLNAIGDRFARRFRGP